MSRLFKIAIVSGWLSPETVATDHGLLAATPLITSHDAANGGAILAVWTAYAFGYAKGKGWPRWTASVDQCRTRS